MDELSCPGCKQRDAQISALTTRVAELEALVHDLTRKLQPPPPRNPAAALPKGPAKKPSGRKPGGQPGHGAHLKKLLPIEQVDHVVPLLPERCRRCQAPLPAEGSAAEGSAQDAPPVRHQVVELPAKLVHVTEYQGHSRTCPCCGEVTQAVIPPSVRAVSLGPKLTATMSFLVGCQGMSKRGVEETVEVVLGVPISLGTIANLEQEMSAALAPVHQQALAQVQQAEVKNVDETGWKKAGHKRWLWVAASSVVVAFLIQLGRNLKAMHKILGEQPQGIVGTDRWCVYDNLPNQQRQLCWAHLQRNWHKLAERGGKCKELARACLDVHRRLFEIWHLYRGGTLNWIEMQRRIGPLRQELHTILEQGSASRVKKLARFCTRLLKLEAALWTFTRVQGVEPTNNHGERVQRRAVLWRRRAFGCHSESGCRFAERLLTVVESLRLQKRQVLSFLQQALIAHRTGQPAPRLVPLG